ncbi:NAD(P) transhydrogenase subunit alpha [Zoogloea sp.]|uniref:NAD(P) transhydrogenase subunit alpha n=1 Tax=Zoogloea sp. TaxID=49181 RepID=UPI0035B28443
MTSKTSITIGVPKTFRAGECRLPLTPEVAGKYRQLGARVLMQRGAGQAAHFADEAFVGVDLVDTAAQLFAESDIVLSIQPPAVEVLQTMKPAGVLVGSLQPWSDAPRVGALAQLGLTSFAMELLPRISRAQSMDVLSSQAAVAGYECALIAADHCPKFFPMLTYAAGTIRPAKVLVIGAGVAGLQAMATARRLGAMVSGYDVRPETREQIESLGARFVDAGVTASGAGGYARELSADEVRLQRERLTKAIADCDALITTAAVPGKRAPLIVDADMLRAMRPGAVVVDLAAESGGNVAGTQPGEKIRVGEVLLIGPTDIASRMPVHASEMYARNLFNFLSPLIKDGELVLDWNDEVVAGTCLTHDGEIRHEGVRRAHGLCL